MCLLTVLFHVFNNPNLLFSVSRGLNYVDIQKQTHVFINLSDHKDIRNPPTVISITHVITLTDVTMANFMFTNSATENICSRTNTSFFTSTTQVPLDHNISIINILKKYMIH
jgi:hypothetical protein